MTTPIVQLQQWMDGHENEHLEFKEAKNHFDFEKLVKYCCALANEGGGTIILGVTDKQPRRVVGCTAFDNLERTKAGLVERLHLRIDAERISHPDGEVLIFHPPSRPIGFPIQYRGTYWMRAGEDLVPMTADQLKRIFAEAGPDYSAEVCSKATLADLDPAAIATMRAMWRAKSNNPAIEHLVVEQLLVDAELLVDGGLTYAALILLGTRQALGKHLGQAEVVYEYRLNRASTPYQQREEYRRGFFAFKDDLWRAINQRNDLQRIQIEMAIRTIPTFTEDVVLEAILNAVSHRDYRLGGSVFVRQYPREMEIVSPGGFPSGITPENVLWKQFPRNRRVAEVFARCGLLDRSGQGVNRMFEESIKQSKPRPDFTGTDDFEVVLTLRGDVQDPRFLRFLENVGQDRLSTFTTRDLLALDAVRREQPLADDLKPHLTHLIEEGLVERIGRGRGTRYILSRGLYHFLGQKGVYTRKRGLDRESHKALLCKHIEDNESEGSPLADLMQVLPSLSRQQVQRLLEELADDGRVHLRGRTRGSRWYPGPEVIARDEPAIPPSGQSPMGDSQRKFFE